MASNSNEKDHHCQFFLTKKKRYCRFKPKPNATYCPEHACVMGVVEDRKRIPCPLNPNHNCYEDELKKHLKKCNVTKIRQAIEKLPYYIKDVNKGIQDDCSSKSTAPILGPVKHLTSERLGALIEKVDRLYSEVVTKTEKLYLEHPGVKEEIMGNSNEDFTKAFGDQAVLRKEMLQQASLVGQLENLGLLSNGYHYVELGAGKGKLSHWIHKACGDCGDSSFLLVERSSVRYKVDPYGKREEGEKRNFQRIKIDIQDFCLGKVPGIQNRDSIVVVGKHLCGGATDLGIRCGVNTLHPTPPTLPLHQTPPLKPEPTDSPLESPQSSDSKLSNTSVIKSNACQLLRSKKDEQFAQSNSTKKEAFHSPEEKSELHCDTVLHGGPPPKKTRLQDGDQRPCKLKGIMIALCCHHRCTWDVYVGQDFMRRLEVNEEEFDLLTRLSSWATCARTRVRGKTTTKKSAKDKDCKESEVQATADVREQVEIEAKETKEEYEEEMEEYGVDDLIGGEIADGVHLRERLSVAEREIIGRKAKRIIDQGRIEYLHSQNMTCCLREYISDDVTPENVVLIATARGESLST